MRAAEYPWAAAIARGRIKVEEPTGAVHDRPDILFYFIGASTVPGLDSNRFVPGAIADHLTSFGGMLTDSPQMSSLRWLQAGATGSYGTVAEPCNFRGKFPDIPVLLAHYLAGESLIEAYWKSVQMLVRGSSSASRSRPPSGSASQPPCADTELPSGRLPAAGS